MQTFGMILIPAGECLVGDDDPDYLVTNYGWPDLTKPGMISRAEWFKKQHETPSRTVWVDSYWIEVHPVTNGQYSKFVSAGGYQTRDFWDDEGWEWVQHYNISCPDPRTNWRAPDRALHPIAGVNWFEAFAYAKWAGKRLPTAEEWECAARGYDRRIWPWGSDWEPDYLNSTESRINDTTPVGSFPKGKSPFGCYDMAGNVDEWTIDTVHSDNRGLKRGGTWRTPGWHCRCSHRCGSSKEHRNPTIGFRCCSNG